MTRYAVPYHLARMHYAVRGLRHDTILQYTVCVYARCDKCRTPHTPLYIVRGLGPDAASGFPDAECDSVHINI